MIFLEENGTQTKVQTLITNAPASAFHERPSVTGTETACRIFNADRVSNPSAQEAPREARKPSEQRERPALRGKKGIEEEGED